MRGAESEGSMDIEDEGEIDEIFGTGSDDLELGAGAGPKADDADADADADPELDAEDDEELMEPAFDRKGQSTGLDLYEDAELEAFIDAEIEDEEEDEYEMALLQELGIELGDDDSGSSSSLMTLDSDSADSEGLDDEVAA